MQGCDYREDILNVSHWFRKAIGSGLAARTAFLFLVVVFFVAATAALACAQSGAMTPYQGEADGVSGGGKWLEFNSTDKMTGEKQVRFELQSDNYFKEDQDYKPRVNLVCRDGKLKWADFNPGVRLAPPNRPGFWGQPQLDVMVRVDDVHYHKGWNWERGRFLSMDKGTVRGMIGATVFNVELRTRSGRQIAEFSPSGLNFDRIKQACDLTPKKPGKD